MIYIIHHGASYTSPNNLQSPSDGEIAAKQLAQNEPYIGIVVSDASLEYIIVAERIPIAHTKYILSAMVSIIAASFSFNVEYPQGLKPLLIFVQHFILGIKDSQAVPNAAGKLYSALDKL